MAADGAHFERVLLKSRVFASLDFVQLRWEQLSCEKCDQCSGQQTSSDSQQQLNKQRLKQREARPLTSR